MYTTQSAELFIEKNTICLKKAVFIFSKLAHNLKAVLRNFQKTKKSRSGGFRHLVGSYLGRRKFRRALGLEPPVPRLPDIITLRFQ